MAEFSGSTKKQFLVVSSRKLGFRASATLVADTITLLDATVRIPRLGSVRPTELDITFGILDDPADELVEYFLANFDAQNLPDLSGMRDRAIWQSAENWRVLGTPANSVQTLSNRVLDFFNGPEFAVTDVSQFASPISLGFLCNSNAASDVLIQGTLFYTETLIQRVWGNDNAWAGYMAEEADDDEMSTED